MEDLGTTIRQFRSGAFDRAELFARIDSLLASGSDTVFMLLRALNDEHRHKPLPIDVYAEVERRIARAVEARQRAGADDTDTYVQTKPLAPSPPQATAVAGAGAEASAQLERMKGVGDTLNGRFVLEECIGFGGMGTVYKALDLRKLEASDRNPYIAIKVLNVQFQGHPKSLIALQREARKAQSLAHPNIVAVYDFDRDSSMVYLTMEYLVGRPLSQLLRAPNFRGLPFADAMKIVSGTGKALAYAHEHGFVHCDFKPANVILLDTGDVKVIDFGIARVFQKAEEDADVTVFDPGSLGALTPAYASPEMLESREPDPRDDIYALGCITYELLTGRHPFNRVSATQARDAGMRPQRPPGLGHRQWRALRCALAFERGDRIGSVTEFLREIGARRAVPRKILVVGAGVAAVAALAVAGIGYLQTHPAAGPPPAGMAAGRAASPATVAQAPADNAPAPQAPADKAPAPQAATVAPVAPAVAPPVTLGAVTAALGQVPCSALAPAIDQRTVRVQGYLARNYGQARLKDMLAALPGVASVELALTEVDDGKCPILNVLGRYWSAQRMAGGSAAIRLAPAGGTQLKEGDTLMVDITTPDYQSYVTVDYFVLDGKVVHLLPNPLERENLAPPRYTATIGSLGNWVIGKPFGTEMLVLLATPVPAFGQLRPPSEPGADYLRELDQQLARISKERGASSVAVNFLQITTTGRR
jgi:eukaryotic-like serine/threonine-protein kinase